MANQYGTKKWAQWASNNVGFALMLLKTPDKEWEKGMTHLEAAIKSLGILEGELNELQLPH